MKNQSHWCEHITYKDRSFKWPDESGYKFHLSSVDINTKNWIVCPICKKGKPFQKRGSEDASK